MVAHEQQQGPSIESRQIVGANHRCGGTGRQNLFGEVTVDDVFDLHAFLGEATAKILGFLCILNTQKYSGSAVFDCGAVDGAKDGQGRFSQCLTFRDFDVDGGGMQQGFYFFDDLDFEGISDSKDQRSIGD